MQGSFHTQTGGPPYSHPQLSRPACPLASRAPLPALPSSLQSPLQKALRPLLQRYTANPDSFTIQMGGGEGGSEGRGPSLPEIGRKGFSIPGSEKGEPSFPSQASGLCLSWGALEASFVPGSHPPNQTPSPPPVRPLLCQLDWDNKRHPLPRLPSPSRCRRGGWEGGAPQGSQGAAESHSPSIVAPATRTESRGSSSSNGGVSMVWADASSSPHPLFLLLLVLAPPTGGSPFIFLSPTLLFLSFP